MKIIQLLILAICLIGCQSKSKISGTFRFDDASNCLNLTLVNSSGEDLYFLPGKLEIYGIPLSDSILDYQLVLPKEDIEMVNLKRMAWRYLHDSRSLHSNNYDVIDDRPNNFVPLEKSIESEVLNSTVFFLKALETLTLRFAFKNQGKNTYHLRSKFKFNKRNNEEVEAFKNIKSYKFYNQKIETIEFEFSPKPDSTN
ncbi:MAG: hypothetical protein NXI00_13140 [Cytophagales bacterium]|nr:hypothetical protein [Cytophagales bacterium]